MLLGPVARQTLSNLRDVLYPPTCPICREETSVVHALCPSCWGDIAFLAGQGCYRCGRPVDYGGPLEERICDDCLHHPRPWQRGVAVAAYGAGARRLVLGLKHGDRLDLVPTMAGWMGRAGGALLSDADLIAPVPLHWRRRLKRRANQAAELARRLARDIACPEAFAPDLLRRTRFTGTQDGKDRAARVANLEGALVAGRDRRLTGARVVLIDDVMTTGATLEAATRVLLDNGARAVDILVMALAMRDHPTYVPREAEENADDAR